ncbi:Na+/H+ antiporter NhaA [Angustibacter sp. McL0619]|uniref:Na+/H+ antiporter NhaA n=1 Tax=Angustibacter sp. McL0619 TaxID=3415676 RepID=UPI003CF04A78
MSSTDENGQDTGVSTPWRSRRNTPVREFVRTETGSAALIVVAIVVALAWVAMWPSGYENFWTTPLSVSLNDRTLGLDLRGWVNSGLMTFFFLVIGLEARRALDIGELRARSRTVLPVVAGLAGMAVAALVYLALNAGTPAAHGWGVAISTDTAFALGLLALLRAQPGGRLRTFLLTVLVVDDVLALLVIAIVYSDDVQVWPLVAAVALFSVIAFGVLTRRRHGATYTLLSIAVWAFLFESGVDPLVLGLALGLLLYADPVEPDALETATERFRSFREQPTSELAREAQLGLRFAVSPNERLQNLFHPWTSYVIVPVFALANAGIPLSRAALDDALHSPITIAIVLAFVVGKPVGVLATAWLVRLVTGGRLQPAIGWGAVAGGAAATGATFTVSLLIASLAFRGAQLEQAKIGVLAATVLAALVTWLVFRVLALLPPALRNRATYGAVPALTDLTEPVDPERDHIRGPLDAPVTLVEYGDLECPYCGQAEPAVRELLTGCTDVRYVWRHLPLRDVHPRAQVAAVATEAAGRQDAFWQMRDLLLTRQDALAPRQLVGYARELGLDVEQFTTDLMHGKGSARIDADVEGAAASGVRGTPTFFVNGRRHHGAFDLPALLASVDDARRTLGLSAN